eukprot:scaffold36956_cov62-Phaeocystis_antarctica.AAC.3
MEARWWECVGKLQRKQAACREGPTVGAAGRAWAERTQNMNDMSVTPEVSQLDMSALNWSNGGRHVSIVLLGRRLQGGRVRKGVGRRRLRRCTRRVGRRRGRLVGRRGRRRRGRRAGRVGRQRRVGRRRWRACAQTAPSPSRTVTSDELGTARPCTTDQELVRVVQTVCVLPS